MESKLVHCQVFDRRCRKFWGNEEICLSVSTILSGEIKIQASLKKKRKETLLVTVRNELRSIG